MTLTAGRLRELLHYDPETGIFTRRIDSKAGVSRKTFSARVGDVAGGANQRGYVRISVDGHKYLAHRLAWLYVHGEFPPHGVDHRYGERSDNRISELRPATDAQNKQNQRRAQSNNKCGLLGVSQNRARWQAQITANGFRIQIGTFDTPELAHAAYLEAKARLHPFQTITTLSQSVSDSDSKLNRACKCTII